MRNIGTLKNPHEGVALGRLLNQNNIKNQIEVIRVDDPTDPAKQSYTCQIWIYDEDDLEKAEFLYDQFVQEESNHLTDETVPFMEKKQKPLKQSPITTALLSLCITVFLFSEFTSPLFTEFSKNPVLAVPMTSSPIKQTLLYDWPKVFSQVDQMVAKYGQEPLLHPDDLPPEGKKEFNQIQQEPVWFGIYPYLTNHNIPYDPATLFYKIRQGEIWRLITPIFLHFDLFHIFFNMLWLIYLGRMLESVLRPIQYIGLILMAAIVTNTAQYLMTGPNFLGYSGVLTAYLGFIWIRQKIAPWEAYPLPKSVITFMGVFVFGMFGLSLISFLTEREYNFSLAPGIANTAHVVGIFIGILLGLLPFFAAKRKRS